MARTCSLRRCSSATLPSGQPSGIKVSLQLAQDSPILVADYLAPAFAQRFQRGISAQFITSLLADADEYGSSSTSTITPDDLFGIMGSLDDAYGMRAVGS